MIWISDPKDGNPGDVRNGDSGVCFHICFDTCDEPVDRNGDYGPIRRPNRHPNHHPIHHPNRHIGREHDNCGVAHDGESVSNLRGSTAEVRS